MTALAPPAPDLADLATLAAELLPGIVQRYPDWTGVQQRAWARTEARRMTGDWSQPATETERETLARYEAARTDAVLWERLHASYGVPLPGTVCVECGEPSPRWLTTDLLCIPITGGGYEWFRTPPRRVMRMALGNVWCCESCCFDEVKATARRKRRNRTKNVGQYIAEAA